MILRSLDRFTRLPAAILLIAAVAVALGAAQTKPGTEAQPATRVEIRVDGLASQSDVDKVTRALMSLRGVQDVTVARDTGLVVMTMGPDFQVSMVTIISTLQRAGYSVPGVAGTSEDERRAVGKWKGFLGPSEERVDIVVDIAMRESGDLVGEIDIPAQGLENLPVGIDVTGRNIVFQINPQELSGEISEDGRRITGFLSQGQSQLPLDLTRAGEPEVSAAGIAFQARQLNPLSRDARELRKRFNADVDKVRLVMLLAPS